MTHKLPPIVSDSQNLLSIKEQSQGSIHLATSPNRVQWALKFSYLSLNSCHLYLDLIKKGTVAHYWSFYLSSFVFFSWSIFFLLEETIDTEPTNFQLRCQRAPHQHKGPHLQEARPHPTLLVGTTILLQKEIYMYELICCFTLKMVAK